jgi:hypothetical protein
MIRKKCFGRKNAGAKKKKTEIQDGSHIYVYGPGLHPAGNLRPGETLIGDIIYSDSPNVLLGMQFSIRKGDE